MGRDIKTPVIETSSFTAYYEQYEEHTFIQGNNSAGEPYVSFGNFSTQWYDSDTGSGSTTYTLTVSNRSTSYFDLETQLSAQPST